jgi:hypothetical protein
MNAGARNRKVNAIDKSNELAGIKRPRIGVFIHLIFHLRSLQHRPPDANNIIGY